MKQISIKEVDKAIAKYNGNSIFSKLAGFSDNDLSRFSREFDIPESELKELRELEDEYKKRNDFPD